MGGGAVARVVGEFVGELQHLDVGCSIVMVCER